MKARCKRRSGQTMVEYIIIVALVAIGLITLFGLFSRAVGTKVGGATAALDRDIGDQVDAEVNRLGGDRIRTLNADGTFN